MALRSLRQHFAATLGTSVPLTARKRDGVLFSGAVALARVRPDVPGRIDVQYIHEAMDAEPFKKIDKEAARKAAQPRNSVEALPWSS